MKQIAFESTLEKLGRILASQYNIEVIFEGNQAYTDGKKIVLPYIQNISQELKADLNGYLDHEVGHCRYTKFDEMKKIKSRMHQELFNAAEDVRIEKEMIADLPGTAFNLDPLNEKMRAKIRENWAELPWPIRTIIGIRDLMEGRAPMIDEDIKRYIDVVKDSAVELRKCKNTEEIRTLTEEIVKKIIEEREEEKKESGDGEQEEGEEGDKDSSPKSGKGDGKGEGKSDDSDSDGEGEDDSKGSSDSGDKDAKGDFDKMLTDKVGDKSEFDKHETDVHDMINKEIEKEVGESMKAKPDHHNPADPVWNNTPSIPVTTRFDKVTNHTGKGNSGEYARLKREIMPLVSPIKSQLERILKVKENAKWQLERERGGLDARSLSKLVSSPGYRTVFKEFTKTETNNVAVEILVDMSGSMGGRMRTAKQAAIAMAEALKDLQIPFEITGFCSEPDSRVGNYAREIGATSGSYYGDKTKSGKRFNRFHERLDLHVFKDFDSNSLIGIEKMFVGSQNPDGECVTWAAKRLALRKEKRKILMVLSDGEPATGDSNRAILCSDLKAKVAQIQKSGIECIGIGIETDAPKHFYPDYIVLNNVADLPKSAMRKLSSLIQKG